MALAYPARPRHSVPAQLRLSGLEPLNYAPDEGNMRSTFLNIGERCNVAGSIIYKKAIVAGDYDKAASIALSQVGMGWQRCWGGQLAWMPGQLFAFCRRLQGMHVVWGSICSINTLANIPGHTYTFAAMSAGWRGGGCAGHQHGRRPDRRRARHDSLCQPAGVRPGGQPRALHDRLLQVLHH